MALGCHPHKHNHNRHSRHVTLDNELQVLLVSDAVTDKAAASLAVRVGEL